ncbi:unnamed protein product [Moneuplotes crassus]|uniref:F-box domain-containing protein n=1 Tax=Euplotes crassus TaxID=5936 RepID=A0AAD1XPB9_EUPCR|nr:unnamed protein product [Moneuplotes crassus]
MESLEGSKNWGFEGLERVELCYGKAQMCENGVLTLNLGSLAEVFTFIDLSSCLDLRLVCKKFNQSICYGWSIRIYELECLIKKSKESIESEFDTSTLEKHYHLKSENSKIEEKLHECLTKSKGRSKLFPEVQDIGYMPRPCRALIVPFLTSLILMGWELPEPHKYDFSSRKELKQIWLKFRGLLRNKKFIKMTESFKVSNITHDQLRLVKKIYSVHTDLTFAMISKECAASAYLFLWYNQLMEYLKLSRDLENLGIKQIEDKMDEYEGINKKMVEVFNKILANQEF